MRPTIEDLGSENQHLRNLVVSLSATVLRSAAVNFYKNSRAVNSTDAGQFVREADNCFRCAKIPGLKKEIADGLEVAGNELLAKAVEIEAIRQVKKEKIGTL